MKILEEKRGHYHLAQDGDRYYLGVPDRYLVKLKPREVKDYLKWGTKALDELSHYLSCHPDKLEARNLAGVNLDYALRQYRVANGLTVLVERDGRFEWEVVSGEEPPPDAYAPMRLLLSSRTEQWSFFRKGDDHVGWKPTDRPPARYFLCARWSSGMADLTFFLELLPEEVASYKAFGDSCVREPARKVQQMSGGSPEFRRNMNYHVADRTPDEVEANRLLMEEMTAASFAADSP